MTKPVLFLGLALALMRAPSCTTPGPVPPPETPRHVLDVVVVDDNDVGLADVLVDIVDGPNADKDLRTNRDGRVTFPSLEQAGQTLCVRPEGFHELCLPLTLTKHQRLDFVVQKIKVDPPPPPPVRKRTGTLQANNFVFVDGDGPRNYVGASLFWGAWGYKHDRARLEANLKFLSGKVDYVRVLAQVGPAHWTDRVIGPADADFDATIAGFTDLAYDTYGLRTQWVAFGGVDQTQSRESRRRQVQQMIALAPGRQHKIQHWEVANEAYHTFVGGSGWPTDELREYARMFAETGILTAVSAPSQATCLDSNEWYRGSAATMLTWHFDRDSSKVEGPWRPVRQPWREAEFKCNGMAVPMSNNEPIGPQSSVAADADPVRIVMNAAVSHLTGIGMYVYHSAAGIRGGGRDDRSPAYADNWWEVENVEATLQGMQTIQALLPPDIGNWSKQNGHWADHPFSTGPMYEGRSGVVRHYGAVSGNRFVTMPIGIFGSVTLTAKHAMTFAVHHPITGTVVANHSLNAGQSITLTDSPAAAYVIIGEMR